MPFLLKSGSDYKVRTWGLKHRDIEKHLDQYRSWLTECVEAFGEEIGERLFLKTYHSDNEFRHTLEVLPVDLAREMDLGSGKFKAVFDATNATPEQIEDLKQKAAQMGARVRPLTKAEEDALEL